jgi:alkanesulfonate monooxygenase SsuD/methylene tetrahydromethanopterin reductase-like flavin-dependent oxidoreductase (luciferase family)
VSGILGQRLAFGVDLSDNDAEDLDALVAAAQHAEALGYDLLSLEDHLHGSRPSVEPWTTLTWLAASTSRVEVTSNVLALPYRHPAVIAKAAANLDRLSHGRVVLALGGGGFDGEFEAFGLTARTPAGKVAAQAEGVQIVKGLWREPSFSFAGDQFHVTDAQIAPKPQHAIPIWLGAYGDRALAATGTYADGWLPSLRAVPFLKRGLDEMRDLVRKAAVDAGRDPDGLTCALNVVISIGRAGPAPLRSTPTGEMAGVSEQVRGSAEQVAEQLAELVRRGFTVIISRLADPEQRERMAGDVIPRLRHEFR